MSSYLPTTESPLAPNRIFIYGEATEVETNVPSFDPPQSPNHQITTSQKIKDFMKTHKEALLTMGLCLALMAASITLCSLGLLPLGAAITVVVITALVNVGGIMEIKATREREHRFQQICQNRYYTEEYLYPL